MTWQFSGHLGHSSFIPAVTLGMRSNQLCFLMQETQVHRGSGNSLGVHSCVPEVGFKSSSSCPEGSSWGSQWLGSGGSIVAAEKEKGKVGVWRERKRSPQEVERTERSLEVELQKRSHSFELGPLGNVHPLSVSSHSLRYL